MANGCLIGGSIANQGIWIIGPNDPNWASPPAGWRTQKAVTFVGVGTSQWAGTSYLPACYLYGCSETDINKPVIWLSGTNSPYPI